MVAVKRDKINGDALGTGRRNTSVARVRIRPGSGKVTINGREFEVYFPNEKDRSWAIEPVNIVNRRGDVENVQLLESSGYPLLDREAMESVRQGATYGPLPRAYPHEQLNIMAFFQYGIGGNIQYRRRVY